MSETLHERQEIFWEAYWGEMSGALPREILYSRFTQEAYQCLKNLLGARTNRRILEVGCGTGRFTCLTARDFPSSSVIGVDITASSLRLAKALRDCIGASNAAFIRADQFRLPFRDACFDAVFSEGVIEHFPLENERNYIAMLKEMTRVIRRGGTLIAAVPNIFCISHTCYKWCLALRGVRYEYGYEKSFTRSELSSVFSALGMRDIEDSGFYPAHGFYRLEAGRFGALFHCLGAACDAIHAADNRLTGRFAHAFGYEIVVKGMKH